MSLLTEVLIISGVAMDLVGAGVLSHAHNAESIAEIKAEIGAEKKALGEDDAICNINKDKYEIVYYSDDEPQYIKKAKAFTEATQKSTSATSTRHS